MAKKRKKKVRVSLTCDPVILDRVREFQRTLRVYGGVRFSISEILETSLYMLEPFFEAVCESCKRGEKVQPERIFGVYAKWYMPFFEELERCIERMKEKLEKKP